MKAETEIQARLDSVRKEIETLADVEKFTRADVHRLADLEVIEDVLCAVLYDRELP